MLAEKDMVALIREAAQKIAADSKKEFVSSHKLREIASLFGLIGSTKKEGKYILIADVFGTLEGQLRRLPSDWRMLDSETKKELQIVIGNATDRMLKVAESIENNPDHLFQALSEFEVSCDEVRCKAEEISKRLPKAPGLEQLLKGE